MQKIEVLVALLHLHYIDFAEVRTDELKIWLHSLRNINREIEREIVSRGHAETKCKIPILVSHQN